MGKAHKTKKRTDQYLEKRDGAAVTVANTASNDLEADLGSLEEKKRANACSMLADVYYFNNSNNQTLNNLTTLAVLNKLALRLNEPSHAVKTNAATALHNLTECDDKEVFNRIMNATLFRSSVSLVLEEGAIAVNGGVFVEQLLFAISNAVSHHEAALKELLRTASSFVQFLMSLLTSSAPRHCVKAAAHALAVLTHPHTTPLQSLPVNVEAVVSRVWSFMKEVEPQASSSRPTAVVLIQCCEVLCNVFVQLEPTPQVVEQCHLGDIAVFLVGLLGNTQVNETSEEVSGHTLIELVNNALLNLIDPLQVREDPEADPEPGKGLIERLRAVPLSPAAQQRHALVADLLHSHNVTPAFYAAINGLISATKASLESCVTMTRSIGTPPVETTSRVITKPVLTNLECLEQLLQTFHQYTLFKASRGAFTADFDSLLVAGQFLLDLVAAASPSSEDKRAAASWSFAEDVVDTVVKDVVISTASSLLELVEQLVGVAYTRAAGPLVPIGSAGSHLHLSDATLSELYKLLARGSSYPLTEIAVTSVVAIGALGTCAAKEPVQSPDATGETVQLSVSLGLLKLFTLALLNRLSSPNAYSYESNTKTSPKENLHLNTLIMMDACFNAVIDTHSSDAPDLLAQVYVGLSCGDKLRAAQGVFVAQLCLNFNGNVDMEVREQLELTSSNVGEFVAYKQKSSAKAGVKR